MKLLKLSAVALFMAFAFNACKKDKTDVTPEVPAIHGRWVSQNKTVDGTYETLKFNVKDKGVLELLGDNPNIVEETGTWKLTGTTFEITVPYDDNDAKSVTIIATFDGKGELTNGKGETDNHVPLITDWKAYKWL